MEWEWDKEVMVVVRFLRRRERNLDLNLGSSFWGKFLREEL